MSDCDISAAENVDTTDEGYLNYLIAEKEARIKELEQQKRELVNHIAEDIGYPDYEIWDSIAYPDAESAVMESVMARKA